MHHTSLRSLSSYTPRRAINYPFFLITFPSHKYEHLQQTYAFTVHSRSLWTDNRRLERLELSANDPENSSIPQKQAELYKVTGLNAHIRKKLTICQPFNE